MIDLKNKRLYRSPKQGIIAGIAAGVAHYLEVDAVFVRLVWLVLGVITHLWPTVVLYAILFFLVPVDPSQVSVPSHQEPKDVTPPSESETMDSSQNM